MNKSDPVCDSLAEGACTNTDSELWRESFGDFYANSVHVTKTGSIGINVGGIVIVMPLEKWHAAALATLSVQPVPNGSVAWPGWAEDAAETYAYLYQNDTRQNIRVDVLNAFRAGIKRALSAAPSPTPPTRVALSEEDIVAALVKSRCHGVRALAYESGPYDLTRPTRDATNFAHAIIAKYERINGINPQEKTP